MKRGKEVGEKLNLFAEMQFEGFCGGELFMCSTAVMSSPRPIASRPAKINRLMGFAHTVNSEFALDAAYCDSCRGSVQYSVQHRLIAIDWALAAALRRTMWLNLACRVFSTSGHLHRGSR
jgi:hypothetical protein